MSKSLFLKIWTMGMGAMDALTGLLLILVPKQVLALLGIAPPSPDGLVFLSWIGVFVMAVGLSYGMALGKRRSRSETVWAFTALVRVLVAVFLTIKITEGALPSAWATVAVSDGFVALVQVTILRKDWWREEVR